jgi:CheY-like chemotaxis protein
MEAAAKQEMIAHLINEGEKDQAVQLLSDWAAQTAYGLSGDREKAIAAGCNDYVTKPINKKELLALMQKYFRKQK